MVVSSVFLLLFFFALGAHGTMAPPDVAVVQRIMLICVGHNNVVQNKQNTRALPTQVIDLGRSTYAALKMAQKVA